MELVVTTDAATAAATAVARTIEVVGVVGGLSISVLRMTIVCCRRSSGRCRRSGLPRLGHHVFVVYLHHPDNSRVVPAKDQGHARVLVYYTALA
jgi:UDP-N-acetylmuramyl tripeptide synthase